MASVLKSSTHRPQDGRPVCLITGATSGIGRAAALALAEQGWHLVLTGRNEQAGRTLADRISRGWPQATASYRRADLSVSAEVRALADWMQQRFSRLDVLINNAGARFDTFQQTVNGIERTFATNHLGHFLLTALLLDRLLAAPSAGVVTTGSGTHAAAPVHGKWCLGKEDWDRKVAYAKSKLANIMFAYELARRTAGTGVTSNAVDPGGVASRFARNNGLKAWLKHMLFYALKGQLLSPRRGADTLVYLASEDSLRGRTGRYYHQRREIRSSPASYNEAMAGDLWRLSVQMSGLEHDVERLSEQARRILLG